MFSHRELVILILALTLHAQVHTGEIYGGHEVVPHSRPYMVLLGRHMKDGGKAFCGGFLLSEDFVMTAAHCKASSYKVSLGLHNVRDSNEIQLLTVEKSFPHESYNATGFQNDIMLLKLSSKAILNQNVKPIPLADRGDDSLPKSCSVSGWGRSDRDVRYMSPKLMEVNITLIDSEQPYKEKSYCSKGEAGPGQGDSGGPLVCGDGRVYGVVSASVQIQPISDLYCYTKIPEYRDWIDGIMKKYGKL